MIQNLNEKWFIYLNNFADSEIIQTIFGLIADLPIFFLPIFLFGMWIYYAINNKNSQKINLLFIFYSTVLALIFNYIIKQFVHFDRPDTVDSGVNNLLLSRIPEASFPSDHAAVSMAFVMSIYLVGYKKLAYICLPIAIIMNISRIISGVHWPFDIIIGSFIGVISGIIMIKLLKNNKIIKKINNFFITLAGKIKL